MLENLGALGVLGGELSTKLIPAQTLAKFFTTEFTENTEKWVVDLELSPPYDEKKTEVL